MTPGTIVAAVMTYNRRDSLRRCLEAIRGQTLTPAEILVVDNASTDGTDAMLAQEFPEAKVRRTRENNGCAGAMDVALRFALTFSPEYIWFFDDDAIPRPSCLETLYREIRDLERERRLGVLRPMIRDPQSGDVVGGGMSHGALLRADMVAAVAYPHADLFIELSDHSYVRLLRKAGYEILRLPIVLVDHPVDRPRSLREVIAEGYQVKPWRLYYRVRNRIYYSLYVQRSIRELLRHLAITARTVALLTIFGRPRRGHLLVARGVLDGMLARLGRRVEPSY
jgi:GT2 family glycosyltransferase